VPRVRRVVRRMIGRLWTSFLPVAHPRHPAAAIRPRRLTPTIARCIPVRPVPCIRLSRVRRFSWFLLRERRFRPDLCIAPSPHLDTLEILAYGTITLSQHFDSADARPPLARSRHLGGVRRARLCLRRGAWTDQTLPKCSVFRSILPSCDL
jgi:hypothetical protein